MPRQKFKERHSDKGKIETAKQPKLPWQKLEQNDYNVKCVNNVTAKKWTNGQNGQYGQDKKQIATQRHGKKCEQKGSKRSKGSKVPRQKLGIKGVNGKGDVRV